MKRVIAVWILVFCLMSVLYALWLSADIQQEYDSGDIAYEELRDEVYPEDRPHLLTEESDSNSEAGSSKTNEPANPDNGGAGDCNSNKTITVPNMDKVSEVNDELVAWITCPDTVIDYPIAYGEDNIFYLTHLANGKKNANGCLFVDCNNAGDFSDPNIIIYGHNMHSGKMFAALLNYKDQEFYDSHRNMYLTYGDETYRLEIFSAYVTTSSSDAYKMRFQSSSDYADWLREIADRSDFSTDIRLLTNDRIVTLSTCAYDFANARYVVHGMLVKM